MKHLLSGTVLLAFSAFLSRILGVIRTNRFAAYFGAGDISDAYFAAFQIPDLLYNLVIYGAVSAAFVPIFSAYLVNRKEGGGWIYANNLLNSLLLIILAISGILFLFAPSIIPILYPGFSDETLRLTVNLTRIMLLSPIFLGVSSIAGSIQNSFHTFVAYSIAPLLYNLSIIFGIIFLSPIFEIYGVAIGVVIGAFLHMAVQIPVVYRRGFRYRCKIDVTEPDVKKTMFMAIPRIFGLAVTQIALLIEAIIASTIIPGSLSMIRYAQDIQFFPVGIIGISVAVSHFGVISKLAAGKKFDELSKLIERNIRSILFLLIPAAVGIFVLRTDIIRFILFYGEFTEESVRTTGSILGILCVGMWALSLVPFLTRIFYAFHNTITPVIIAVTTIVVHLISAYILAGFYGVFGLAVASVLAVTLQTFTLFFFVRKKLQSVQAGFSIDISFLLTVISASGIMGGMLLVLKRYYNFPALLNLIVFSVVGLVVYFVLTGNLEERRRLLEKICLK